MQKKLPRRLKNPKRKDQICIHGVWLPITGVHTKELIELLNEMRSYKTPTKKQKRVMNFLGWIIDWRNQDHPKLPKQLKYSPSPWELDEVSEYNYPENIYELGLLYRQALVRGSLEQIRILFKIIVKKGYLYRPGKWGEDYWERDQLIPVFNAKFIPEDYRILKERNLI